MSKQTNETGFLPWLLNPNPKDTKHLSWPHPAAVMLIGAIGTVIFCWYFAPLIEFFFPTTTGSIPDYIRTRVGWFLFIYLFGLIKIKVDATGACALYEFLWACNIAFLMSICGLYWNKPNLVGASIVVIAIDQMLWYIDIGCYLTIGKFPIGVAKYLTWPENKLPKKIFSMHHLWFIPVLMYVMAHCGGLRIVSFFISLLLTLILTAYSRLTIPKGIYLPELKHEHYLNINLSWEVWKDIKGFSRVDKMPFLMRTATVTLIWNFGNLVFFLMLEFGLHYYLAWRK